MSGNNDVRLLTDDDWPRILEVDEHAFGTSLEPEQTELDRALQEPGRTIGGVVCCAN